MKLATTTGDFARFFSDDADRIRELHRAGFRYIDLDMYAWKPDSVYMGEHWRRKAEELLELADSLGMSFVQAHSHGGNFISPDPERVEFLRLAVRRSIEVCEVLGIPNTVLHCGYEKDISKEEAFEKNRLFMEALYPTIDRCGVNVLLENSTKVNMKEKYYPCTAKELLELRSYLDHPRIHVCWDTGHGNCEGEQYSQLIELGDALRAIHYNDNHGFKDEHLIPYLGTLNHDEILNGLIDSGYKGCFTLECSSSLIPQSYWLGPRRTYEKDTRLLEPPLFLQRSMERMLYETGEYILRSYGVFED